MRASVKDLKKYIIFITLISCLSMCFCLMLIINSTTTVKAAEIPKFKVINSWGGDDTPDSFNYLEGDFATGDIVELIEPAGVNINGQTYTGSWYTTDPDITIVDNQFIMPNHNVSVFYNYDIFSISPKTERNGTSIQLVYEYKDGIAVTKNQILCYIKAWSAIYPLDASQSPTVVTEYSYCEGDSVFVTEINGTKIQTLYYMDYRFINAVAENNTIGGSAGETINSEIVITLENTVFKENLSGNWIKNLPNGLNQVVSRTNDNTATITINGTPTVGSQEVLDIVIPIEATDKEKAIKVDRNENLKFNIADKTKIYISDGTISHTLNSQINVDQNFNISLENNTFIQIAANTDVSNWIVNAHGLQAKIIEEVTVGATSASIKIYGQAITSSDNENINISIPDAFLNESRSKEFIVNENAKINICNELLFEDDAALDIPSGLLNSQITEINLSTQAQQGMLPYKFYKVSGPSWINVTIDGIVSGSRTTQESLDLIVKVIDANQAEKSITIDVGVVRLPEQESPTDITFSAIDDRSGTLNGTDNTMSYKVGADGMYSICTNNTLVENLNDNDQIYIIKNGVAGESEDSKPFMVTVQKAVKPNIQFEQDLVLNLMNSIEFKSQNDNQWQTCPNASMYLDDGTYLFRVKASGEVLASEAQEIIIHYTLIRSASMSDVTIEGTVGKEIVSKIITITLTNDTFNENVSNNWITNLPSGLGQTTQRIDSKTAKINISGTASSNNSNLITIVIPSLALYRSKTDITVTENTNSKYNIFPQITVEDFSIDSGVINTMSSINIEEYISGGRAPYTIEKQSGPQWIGVNQLNINVIRPGEVQDASELVIKVIDSNNAYVLKTIPVGKVTLPKASMPQNISFTAFDEDSGEVDCMDPTIGYRFGDSGFYMPCIQKPYFTDIKAGDKIYFVKFGTQGETIQSDPYIITITQAEKPQINKNEDLVFNLNSNLEYKLINDSKWTECQEGDMYLDDGTYLFRVKASGEVLASEAQEIIIHYTLTRSATMSDVNIEGTVGKEIVSKIITITLTNDTFNENISNNWITNLPSGLSQETQRKTGNTVEIIISGIAANSSFNDIQATIPSSDLFRSKEDIIVDKNANAQFSISLPQRETPSNIQIKALSEHSIKIVGANLTMQYSINNGDYNNFDDSYIIENIQDEDIIKIINKGEENISLDSNYIEIQIKQAVAPVGINSKNNIVKGVTQEIEYRLVGSSDWLEITSDELDLEDGEYEFRIKANANILASISIKITVKDNRIVVHVIGGTKTENEDGTVTIIANKADEGYEFKGWSNGEEIISTNEKYVVNESVDLTAIFEPIEETSDENTTDEPGEEKDDNIGEVGPNDDSPNINPKPGGNNMEPTIKPSPEEQNEEPAITPNEDSNNKEEIEKENSNKKVLIPIIASAVSISALIAAILIYLRKKKKIK